MSHFVGELLKIWNLKVYWWTLFLYLLQTACLPASTFLCGRLLSAISAKSNINELVYYMAAIWTFSTFITYATTYATAFSSDAVISNLRMKLSKEVLRKNALFFERNSTGSLASTILGDTTALYGAYSSVLPDLLKNMLMTMFSLVVVAFSSYYFFLLALGEAVVVLLITLLSAPKTRRLTFAKQATVKKYASIQHELITNWRVVKVFGLETFFTNRLQASLNERTKTEKSNAHFMSLQMSLATLVSGIVIVGVSYWMQFLIGTGEINIGDVVVIWNSSFNILTSMRSVGYRIGELINMTAVVADMNGVMQFNKFLHSNNGQLDHEPDDEPWTLELKDVFFKYPSSTTNVLTGVNMKFTANCMTAVVGPSGSGKSTTLNLILKFYEPTAGSILVNNENLSELSLQHYYRNIGFVSQEVAIFEGTLEDNIKYGSIESSLQDVEEACKLANIHSFIITLPEGYKTMVGERGVKLSGGQRQRLAIARALIRKPKLLLLDEATSALDTESEQRIQESIENISKSVTTIIIAHRLSTVKEAKTIYVFSKEGNIVEQGTYSELLNQNGVFATMVNAQDLTEITNNGFSRTRSNTM